VELYPAVDVRGGRVAHVRSGNASAASVYGDDPAAAVTRLAAAGARWVHLVDLDRAHGTGSNRELIHAVLGSAPLQVQVGGSLATEGAIEEMLAWGAARVVIGCAAAVTEPALVSRLVRRHGAERLAVGVEATDGRVTPRAGAVRDLPVDLFARTIFEQGGRLVVYTDVTRDGTLTGPDTAGAQLLATLGLEVIVSGGVGSLGHVRAAAAARLAGVIVGRALHEGRFSIEEALACLAA
jgi:phosphoribosylformimino-5-aminoimidazole carboxamide ribotide isomerase